MRRFVWLLALLLFVRCLYAEDALPPAPKKHFNDYAGLVAPSLAARLDLELDNFEKETSTQIVVAILKSLPEGASLEDFTIRTVQAWKVGQKGKNNGAVLFVFKDNRKIYIQTGYGLEASLPDALCKRIIAEQIAPSFKLGDYNRGLENGVHAILSATKGEYKGTGRTNARNQRDRDPPPIAIVAIIIIIVLVVISNRLRGSGLHGGYGSGPTYWGGSGGSGGGGDSGGGGFSGGGGDSGGGGAGGDW